MCDDQKFERHHRARSLQGKGGRGARKGMKTKTSNFNMQMAEISHEICVAEENNVQH